MATVPNAASAVIDPRKVTDYVLEPLHRVGRHKARVFASALGLTKARAHLLVEALQRAILEEEGVLRRTDAYGAHYVVEFIMLLEDRSALIRSLWTIRTGETAPRFVTAFVSGEASDHG